jgi:hypothetical protein
MLNVIARLGICLFTLLISIDAFATATEAGKLIVQITNFTEKRCRRDEWQVTHGLVVSEPAGSLLPSQSTRFVLEQTAFNGPDAFIRYSCGDAGDGTVRFEVQQDLAVIMGHEPVLTVHEEVKLNLDRYIVSASKWSNLPGKMYINILPG